jgi:hypothetical protein
MERIAPIAERFDLAVEDVLSNISYMNATTTDVLESAPAAMAALMQEDSTYRLVIVDSIMGTLRREYGGRGELNERQIRLNGLISRFQKLATIHKLVVIFTNQVGYTMCCTVRCMVCHYVLCAMFCKSSLLLSLLPGGVSSPSPLLLLSPLPLLSLSLSSSTDSPPPHALSLSPLTSHLFDAHLFR